MITKLKILINLLGFVNVQFCNLLGSLLDSNFKLQYMLVQYNDHIERLLVSGFFQTTVYMFCICIVLKR